MRRRWLESRWLRGCEPDDYSLASDGGAEADNSIIAAGYGDQKCRDVTGCNLRQVPHVLLMAGGEVEVRFDRGGIVTPVHMLLLFSLPVDTVAL
jgi:hypothetical protein